MNVIVKKEHDHLAKAYLTDLAVAREFLDLYLPLSVKTQCDLSKIELEPCSFIEDDLKSYYADVVYKVALLNTRNPKRSLAPEYAYIYTLIEHQSSAEIFMPLRFVRYITLMLQRYIDNNPNATKLPLVVPIMFYNGKKTPYPYSCDIDDIFTQKNLYR